MEPAISSSSAPSVRSAQRRRRALRTALGSVLILGAVGIPSATAFADATPTPSATASPTDSPTATPTTTTSPTATPTASATATPTATPSATTTTPAPSPTATDDKGGGGQGPEVPVRCVVTVEYNIGAGTKALTTISPTGPNVHFQVAGETKLLPYSLTRTNPKLPASAGFDAEILDPNSSHPQLRTNMEGGDHPASIHNFPSLPKGCDFAYQTSEGSPTVVPEGGVAAGYEATSDSTSEYLAIGGAAAAVSAAGIAFVVRRRRTAVAAR